jgi:hypothetical protein
MLNPRWPDPAGFPNLGKTGRYFSKDWKWRFFMAKKKQRRKIISPLRRRSEAAALR